MEVTMKLKLRAITDGNDKNRFCGPSVISAVTNLTTGEAARLIRKQTGRSNVMGTHTSEIRQALAACGIETRFYRFNSRNPTLAKWLRESKEDRTPGRVFLIVAGNHWQLVSGRRYACGRIRDIVSIKDKRVKRRARVAEVYELISDNVTKPEIDVTRPKDPFASSRGKTQRLAKKLRVNVEIENVDGYRQIWVLPPPDMSDEEDPLEGHVAYDWDEALDLVQTYETHLANNQ
jgi:hypothetical protein